MNKVLFCDWKTGNPELEICHFFEIEDLKDYDILYFDPLIFSSHIGLRNNIDNIHEAEYIPRSEMEFVRYLAKVKTISSKIKSFLNDGGIWVIRSNFPNSQIRMQKKNSSGDGEPVESLISAFFWIEQFIGKYTFRYTTDKALYYRDKKNAIFRKLHNNPVICRQTQDQIPVPGVKIIAETVNSGKMPAVTMVRFGNGGEIYFIPYFEAENETELLISTFREMIEEKKVSQKKPLWLGNYEDRLNQVSPYIDEIKEIERTIGRLRQNKLIAQQKHTELNSFVDLLYTEGEELRLSVETALRLVGFRFPEMPADVKMAGFSLFADEDRKAGLPIHLFASQNEFFDINDLSELQTMVANLKAEAGYKPLLIINAPYMEEPEDRADRFPADLLKFAEKSGICVLTARQLFHIVCHIISKDGSEDSETSKLALRNTISDTCGFYDMDKAGIKANVS